MSEVASSAKKLITPTVMLINLSYLFIFHTPLLRIGSLARRFSTFSLKTLGLLKMTGFKAVEQQWNKRAGVLAVQQHFHTSVL